jgi:hypothetical protein
VSQTGGSWTLAYAACSGWFAFTVDPRIWYRSNVDGQHWTDPQSLTRPGSYSFVGVGMTAGRTRAIWQHDLSASDEDRAIEGVIRYLDCVMPVAAGANRLAGDTMACVTYRGDVGQRRVRDGLPSAPTGDHRGRLKSNCETRGDTPPTRWSY